MNYQSAIDNRVLSTWQRDVVFWFGLTGTLKHARRYTPSSCLFLRVAVELRFICSW
jgi:hypothetical protein